MEEGATLRVRTRLHGVFQKENGQEAYSLKTCSVAEKDEMTQITEMDFMVFKNPESRHLFWRGKAIRVLFEVFWAIGSAFIVAGGYYYQKGLLTFGDLLRVAMLPGGICCTLAVVVDVLFHASVASWVFERCKDHIRIGEDGKFTLDWSKVTL